MGGNALKSVITRRYERAEFDIISKELLDILKKDFKRVAMPLFYNNKESFGDADIIVSMEDFKGNVRDYITNTFNPNEIFHNGSCYSFDYKELQVDIITVSVEDFDSMVQYLSHNDKGNFQGALMHQFKFDLIIDGSIVNCILKYGQEGFFVKSYYGSIKLGQIILSRDYNRICKFLDLDFDRDNKGFNTLEEIFEFICNSRYFSSEIFQLNNLNKMNRERNVKRKSYMTFLEYLEQFKGTNKESKFTYDNEYILNKLIFEFPEFDNVLDELNRKMIIVKEQQLISDKFNGHILMEKFNLKDKELGNSIKKFKTHLGDNFNKFILDNNTDDILAEFNKIIFTV